MKSKIFGVILGLALSIQGVMGIQSPDDMKAWLKAEFDKCSKNADVRVRKVVTAWPGDDNLEEYHNELLIETAGKSYMIDHFGQLFQVITNTYNGSDINQYEHAFRIVDKDGSKDRSQYDSKNCDFRSGKKISNDSNISCSYSDDGFSVNIQNRINFLYNFTTGELILNNTAYDKKLVIEANRICTAKTVNVKDLVLKSYKNWFLNFGQLNHQSLRVFSHFGVNYGSYNSENTTEWASAQLNLLLKMSENIYNKYAGMNGFYSAPRSACDAQNITTRGIMEVQFGGNTHIGGTLDTDAQVILGYRAGTPDPDSLIYRCNINEIKNAPKVFISTSKINYATNGGIYWDESNVNIVDRKTVDTVSDAYYVTNPPDAVKNVNKNDFTKPGKWYLVGKEDFDKFVDTYLRLSMLNTACKKLVESNDPADLTLKMVVKDFILSAFEDTLLSDGFEKWYDVQLHNNGQSADLKLRVKGTSEGPMITFYSSDGREYRGEEDVNLAMALNNTCICAYQRNENSYKQSYIQLVTRGHDDSGDNSSDQDGQNDAACVRMLLCTRLDEVIGAPSFECEQVEDYIRYPEFALHFFMSDTNKMTEQQSENQDASLIPNGSDSSLENQCSIF